MIGGKLPDDGFYFNYAPKPATTRTRRGRLLYSLAGVAAILVGWQLLSLFVNPALMASPAATVRALAGLAWGSTLWVQLLITLKRLVIGLAVGAVLGLVTGRHRPASSPAARRSSSRCAGWA